MTNRKLLVEFRATVPVLNPITPLTIGIIHTGQTIYYIKIEVFLKAWNDKQTLTCLL